MSHPTSTHAALRIGAVNYLNSKPLVRELQALAPRCHVMFDLPSRLADSLAAARLDVALIPVVEYLRAGDYQIVSDACVASLGEVRSVKLYFRTPPQQVRTLALDEGSRTSGALAQLLLADRHKCRPEVMPLPIGEGPESSPADAVLVIGDRAMSHAPTGFVSEWDLGAEWRSDTGLPFVFACWAARPGVDCEALAPMLVAARDAGVERLDVIAQEESEKLGIDRRYAYEYLTEHLHYKLDQPGREAIRLFESRCRSLGLLEPVEC